MATFLKEPKEVQLHLTRASNASESKKHLELVVRIRAIGISHPLKGDQTQHLLYRLQNGELPKNGHGYSMKSVVLLIGVNNLNSGMNAKEVSYEFLKMLINNTMFRPLMGL